MDKMIRKCNQSSCGVAQRKLFIVVDTNKWILWPSISRKLQEIAECKLRNLVLVASWIVFQELNYLQIDRAIFRQPKKQIKKVGRIPIIISLIQK